MAKRRSQPEFCVLIPMKNFTRQVFPSQIVFSNGIPFRELTIFFIFHPIINQTTYMKNPNPVAKKPVIRPCSCKELAHMYEMDRKTISRWLKPHQSRIGKRIGWYYNIRQMEIIFEVLGMPNCFDEV